MHNLFGYNSDDMQNLPVQPIKFLENLSMDQLQQMQVQYQLIIDTVPLIVFTSTNEGKLIYANKWMEKFTGYTIEQLNNSRMACTVHPEDLERTREAWRQKVSTGFEGGNERRSEFRMKNCSSGEYIWHVATGVPVKSEDGSILYWIGYMVDIHAQKKMEETLIDNSRLRETQTRLKEYQEELEMRINELNRSNAELEQFAYVASHDLQEPLRKIMMFSDQLQKKGLSNVDDGTMRTLEKLNGCCHRMKSLISDLLTFSRIGEKSLNFEMVGLSEVAEQAVQDLEVMVCQKNAIVQIDSLPVVECCRTHMHQLFVNLISNSLKYSKTDAPCRLSISAQHKKNHVVLRFSDNGIGFEEQYGEKIFGLFQRLHTNKEYEGTGIGLTICRKIVQLHRGVITASSKPEEGAVFEVTLPVYRQY